MKTTFSFFVVFLFLILFSCSGEEKGSRPSTLMPAKFESPRNNATYRMGQEIDVKVQLAALEEIESLKIFTKDTIIFEGSPSKENFSFILSTNEWKVGSTQISLEAKLKEGKTRKDNRIVKILPNTFPTEYTAEVVKTYNHATTSYTQGLEFDGDQLYEGTGGRGSLGESMVAKIDLETGKIGVRKNLGEKYFGEGITILGDKLYQLTWQEHTCFVYDKHTLEELNTFTYSGEGWGICNDGEYLITSDGSERLYFRNPETFSIKKSLEVYTNEGAIRGINEMEYIDGKIYANVYTTNFIIIIDPETGVVTGRVDASLLALDYRETGEVLNGIAYKKSTDQLFFTGKNWPYLIEVKLVEE